MHVSASYVRHRFREPNLTSYIIFASNDHSLLLYMIYKGIHYIIYTAVYSYRRVYTGPVRLVDGKFPNWVHRSREERTWDFFFYYFHYYYYLFSFKCIRTLYDGSAFLLFRRRWAKFLRCSRLARVDVFYTFLFCSL